MSASVYSIKKILLLPLFMISCQHANNTYESQIKHFDIKELPKITDIKLSDLGFVDIEYIPLETNENSVISRINEIKVGNEYFLIKFFNRILMFKTDGSYVTKIGTEGRGPNEFLVAHHVDIDKKPQNIYLVDGWARKFYVYSERGNFIKTFQSPLNTTYFGITDAGILCYSTNYIANIDYSYNLIDTEGRIIKKFLNRYIWNYKVEQGKGTAIFDENIFYWFNDKLFKKEVYSDTVYVFENTDFKPHLVIEQGDKLLTTQARSDFEPLYLFEKYISQKNLFEFGDYVYYEFMYDFRIGGSNILRGFIGSKKDNFQVTINAEQGLTNDLDGGPNIWPKTIKDDNTVISWIDALQLKTFVASETFINSIPKYPEKKKELTTLADSLKETDNPVLIMVRLKN